MAPADDSKNRNGVPRGFVHVSVMPSSPPLIYEVQRENPSLFWLTGSITAEKDEVPVGATTEMNWPRRWQETLSPDGVWCGPGPGVVVNTPLTIRRNESKAWIGLYMRNNMDSWLEFANTKLKLGLVEQDIVFVSSTVKTTRWVPGASAGEDFRGEDLEYVSEHPSSSGVHCLGDPFPACHSVAGLAEPSLNEGGECLFIGYFKMKRRTPEWQPARQVSSVEREGHPPGERGCDPVNPFLDYILENSDAIVAAATEGDVIDLLVCNKTRFSDLEHIPEAIRWLSPMIRIDKHGVGTIDCILEGPRIARVAFRKWNALVRKTRTASLSSCCLCCPGSQMSLLDVET
ncbi:hypothetical protein V8D89_009055 [Ganoderma adspersum]